MRNNYFFTLRSHSNIDFREEADSEEWAQGYTREEKVFAEKSSPLAILWRGTKQPGGSCKSCLQGVHNFCQEGRWLYDFDEDSPKKLPPRPVQTVQHDADKGQPWEGEKDTIQLNIRKA